MSIAIIKLNTTPNTLIIDKFINHNASTGTLLCYHRVMIKFLFLTFMLNKC